MHKKRECESESECQCELHKLEIFGHNSWFQKGRIRNS